MTQLEHQRMILQSDMHEISSSIYLFALFRKYNLKVCTWEIIYEAVDVCHTLLIDKIRQSASVIC